MKTKTSLINVGIRNTMNTVVEPDLSAKIIDHNVGNMDETSKMLDSLYETHAEVRGSSYASSLRDGSFDNPVLKLGMSDQALMSAQFLADMITFQRQTITNIYHGSWIFRRLIDKGAQDMWRAGITIEGETDPDELKKVYKRLSKLRSELIWVTGQCRLYGGAASLIMVDDGEKDLSKPLNLKGIKKGSPVHLWSTDRWYGVSTSSEKVSNFKSVDFNTPKYYNFYLDENGTDVSQSSRNLRVHHSRVLRFVNRRSSRIINTRLDGWGISELEHIFQDLLIHENAKNSTGSLIQKALLEIISVPGMRGMLQGLSVGNASSRAMLAGQFAGIESFRTNDLVILDADSQYKRETYQFSGLSELLDTQRDIIAGAAEMPKVLLYGDTKGGLTSDSPAEMEFYAGTINGKQEDMLRPVLDKLIPVLYAAEGIQIPNDLDYDFESIAGESQAKKIELLNAIVNSVTTLVDGGFITHETGLKEILQVQKQTGFGTNVSDQDVELARQSDTPEEPDAGMEMDTQTEDYPVEDEYAEVKDEVVGKKTIFDIFRRKKNK